MNDSHLQLPLGREQIPAVLRQHGILATTQRVDIAAVMLACRQHMAADQVLAQVNARGAGVSKATVYNTLGLFAEKGLIRQVIVDSSRVFYDSNTRPHYHFYNVDDGTLTDIDIAEVRVDALPSPPADTATEAIDVIIRIRNQR